MGGDETSRSGAEGSSITKARRVIGIAIGERAQQEATGVAGLLGPGLGDRLRDRDGDDRDERASAGETCTCWASSLPRNAGC